MPEPGTQSTTQTERPAPIVVGLADTAEARAAVSWAAEEAVARRCPLVLVHAIGDEVGAWLDLEAGDVRPAIDEYTAAAETLIEQARATATARFPQLDTDGRIPLSGPTTSLAALTQSAALVVVGNHAASGHVTGASDAIEHYLHDDLTCPIALVGHRTEGGAGILVVADGTPASRPTLLFAFGAAQRRKQKLTVVMCLPDPAADEPVQDLALMDRVARLDAASGPHLLGLDRSLLQLLVAELHEQFEEVEVETVVDDLIVDELLARAASTMDAIIVDASYTRRLRSMLASSTSVDLAATAIVVPADRSAQWDLPASACEELGRANAEAARRARSLPVPQPGLPGEPVVPELEPALVPVRRRKAHERGPWKYFRRDVDDPDVR